MKNKDSRWINNVTIKTSKELKELYWIQTHTEDKNVKGLYREKKKQYKDLL